MANTLKDTQVEILNQVTGATGTKAKFHSLASGGSLVLWDSAHDNCHLDLSTPAEGTKCANLAGLNCRRILETISGVSGLGSEIAALDDIAALDLEWELGDQEVISRSGGEGWKITADADTSAGSDNTLKLIDTTYVNRLANAKTNLGVILAVRIPSAGSTSTAFRYTFSWGSNTFMFIVDADDEMRMKIANTQHDIAYTASSDLLLFSIFHLDGTNYYYVNDSLVHSEAATPSMGLTEGATEMQFLWSNRYSNTEEFVSYFGHVLLLDEDDGGSGGAERTPAEIVTAHYNFLTDTDNRPYADTQ